MASRCVADARSIVATVGKYSAKTASMNVPNVIMSLAESALEGVHNVTEIHATNADKCAVTVETHFAIPV